MAISQPWLRDDYEERRIDVTIQLCPTEDCSGYDNLSHVKFARDEYIYCENCNTKWDLFAFPFKWKYLDDSESGPA